MKLLKYVVIGLAFFFFYTEEISAKSFEDVKASSELGRAVDYMSEKNIISGYSDNTFRPNNYLTRAQAAKIIATALKIEAEAYKFPETLENDYYEKFVPKSFKDLSVSHDNFKYAFSLKEAAIMSGYNDNTFKPNNHLTRAQIAKVLTLSYSMPFSFSDKDIMPYFMDVKSNSESYPYITNMVNHKIMFETKKNYFSPNHKVTRGELALYIYRLEQYFEKEAEKNRSGPVFNEPGSIVDYFYDIDVPISIVAPIHSVRSIIDETNVRDGIAGVLCSKYDKFTLCGDSYLSDETLRVLILFNPKERLTVNALEGFIGEELELIELTEDGPDQGSVYVDFFYEGLFYSGELEHYSKSSEFRTFNVSYSYEE